jgi:hypothetical protein
MLLNTKIPFAKLHMKSIEFDATFGDKVRRIEITWPTGAPGICHVVNGNLT